MFPRKIRVCELFGIPIYLDFSLIILLVMFVMDFGSFTYGMSFALALAVSITLHELGHSLTARIFGYNAREITLSLLGGCASFINLPRKASQEFLTALAGPLVSFAIAGAAWVAIRMIMECSGNSRAPVPLSTTSAPWPITHVPTALSDGNVTVPPPQMMTLRDVDTNGP
jgi:Zn-dependent protease